MDAEIEFTSPGHTPLLRNLCRYFSERSPQPMVAVEGITHVVFYVNPAFARFVGRKRQDLVGRPFAEVVPEGEGNGCLVLLDRVFRTGMPETLAEQEHRHTQPRPVYWSYWAWAILGADERPAGVMIQVTDATETALFRRQTADVNEALVLSSVQQHELMEVEESLNARVREAHDRLEARVVERTAELAAANESLRAEIAIREAAEDDLRARTEELAKANEALTQSNIGLQQFAYIASHDLQTPLRAISGFAQLLQQQQQGKLGEQADHQIQTIVGGVKRLQALITDLLNYAQVETKERPFTPTDMNAVFQDVVNLLAQAIAEAGASVTRDELPTVMGDRGQLTQLLQNLIGNGLKFHREEPPRVHVSAQHADGVWTFAVRDNGIGIAPQYHEKIFEIFRRLHTQQEYPGTGIGLAVCKRVITRHGGKIWLESEPGKGTTFFFSLPDPRGKSS